MGVRHRGVLAVLGLGIAAGASAAPNLLTNSGFDADLSSWLVVNDSLSQVTFDSTLDVNSSPSSGSAKFSKFSSQFSCQPNLYQCISGVTGGKSYDFGGSIFIPIGQGSGRNAFVDAIWFTNSTCSAGRVPSSTAGEVSATGAWTATSVIGEVAPAGSHSAAINGAVCQVAGGQTIVNYDAMFLQESSVISPFTDLSLIVEGPIRVTPGTPVEYRLRVRNLGPAAALGIRAGVHLPPGLSGLVALDGGSYDPAQGWLSWPLFDQIDPAGQQVFRFTLPDPVRGLGNAVVAMLNGDPDYSNNAVAFQLAPTSATTAVPALSAWALGALCLLLLAAATTSFARSRSRL